MKKKGRLAVLSASLALALLSGGAALLAERPAETKEAAEAPAESPAPLHAEPLSQGGYLLRETDGGVAVYADGKLVRKTGIYPPLLRKADRQALREGIPTDSLEELLRLIEDLES